MDFPFFSSSSLQNSVAVFRELCGVSAVSNLMQCVLALGSRVSAPDGTPLLVFDLQDDYPTLVAQGPLPDVLRRVISTYDTVRKTLSCRYVMHKKNKDLNGAAALHTTTSYIFPRQLAVLPSGPGGTVAGHHQCFHCDRMLMERKPGLTCLSGAVVNITPPGWRVR